jgi:hypothetical protein
MATRVKADDGKLYPPPTSEQKAAWKRQREERDAERAHLSDVYGATYAIIGLAKINLPTSEILRALPAPHIKEILTVLEAAEARLKELGEALRAFSTSHPGGDHD